MAKFNTIPPKSMLKTILSYSEHSEGPHNLKKMSMKKEHHIFPKDS
jgi:hypothetical protein